jgi:3-oxoacyl-[acyl-carrier-protein] synthase-3
MSLQLYIQSGRYKSLTIGADKMSSIVIIQIVLLVFFGDGAGAVLFEPNYEG